MADLPPLPSIPHFDLRPTDTDRLLISFPYHPDTVERIKSIPGRNWHPQDKCWSIPYTTAALERLTTLFDHTPPKVFTKPEHRPGAVTQRRWETLSDDEQALIARVEDEMKLRGYSPKTRKSYRNHILRFKQHFHDRDLSEIGEEEIRSYLLNLLEEKKASRSYHNQTINAVKLLFDKVLRRPKEVSSIPRPRTEHKLPMVLSRQSVEKLINEAGNLKQRTILILMYSGGLRVGEIVRLRPEDLDFDRKMVRVRHGKGNKDRYTLLADLALELTKTYIDEFQPVKWLFPSVRADKHLTESSVQKIVRSARQKAEIPQQATSHTLRHSFATHLLDAGVDLRYIVTTHTFAKPCRC